MDTKQIIFYLIIAVIVYLVYNFFFKDHAVADLQGMHNAKVAVSIAADKMPSSGGSNDYAFSVWFYINNWNYNYGVFTLKGFTIDQSLVCIFYLYFYNVCKRFARY
mgnify:CR=1 FL=1